MHPFTLVSTKCSCAVCNAVPEQSFRLCSFHYDLEDVWVALSVVLYLQRSAPCAKASVMLHRRTAFDRPTDELMGESEPTGNPKDSHLTTMIKNV